MCPRCAGPYAELVKLHREWKAAKAVRAILSYATTPYGELSEAVERLQRAESALAQWEARKALGGS